MGEWLKGSARQFQAADVKTIDKKITSKHGFLGWILGLFERNRVVYSIRPDLQSTAASVQTESSKLQ